jgi:hypothetical protein
MLAAGGWCHQNADWPMCQGDDTNPTQAPPVPAPAPTPQLGIGPDARPKRKKPNREGWAKRLYY